MRVAFVSDLHANLIALDAVLADAAERGADRVVCLGDAVDLGPSPAETLDRLAEAGIACVAGNHDPLDERPAPPHLAQVEAWTAERLGPSRRAQVAGWPASLVLDLDGVAVRCVHGSPRSCTESIEARTTDAELAAMLAGVAEPVVVCGHTHLQLVRRLGGATVVNVGSVGMPFLRSFDGTPPVVLPWAEYAIVEVRDGHVGVELRQVAYDVDAHVSAIRASGMPQPEVWIASLRGPAQVVACGTCVFGMPGTGCWWAVDLDGAHTPMSGVEPADHDPHAPDGMCLVSRRAYLEGALTDGVYVATRFELVP